MIEHESEEKKCEIYNINFTLDDIKPLVLSNIDDAQDINNPHSLSRLRVYEAYHEPLEIWFKKKYNKMPAKADKLAFIILLSYPKKFIINAKTFDEFKLYNNKNEDKSDFKLVGVIDIEFNEHDEFNDNYIDCICSKDNLKYVSRVENKYSHIELYVGSECIRKYKIISKEEIIRMNEINERQKERQKEIKEGMPIGYHEEIRRQNIIKKNEDKLQKAQEKIQKKIDSGNYRICYLCNNTLINIRHNKYIRICERCDIPINVRKSLSVYYSCLSRQILLLCKRYTCNNCEMPFITLLSKSEYLCKKCIIDYKTISCKICNTNILLEISSNDIYCQDCEEKLFKCIDCNEIFIRDINKLDRCRTCHLCFENRMILQKCEECKDSFARKEKENWRKVCNSCFKTNNSKICNICDEEFDVKVSERWKTICSECYKKSKNTYNCSNCEEEFTRLSNETWKTMCYNCYKHFKNL